MSKPDTNPAQEDEVGAGDSPDSPELTEEQVLDQELELLRSKIQKSEAKIAEAQREAAKLTAEADELITKLEVLRPSQSLGQENQRAIARYRAAQRKARTEKHERRQAVLSKMDPGDLEAAAPIDRAMSRRTRRGSSRPKYPATPKV